MYGIFAGGGLLLLCCLIVCTACWMKRRRSHRRASPPDTHDMRDSGNHVTISVGTSESDYGKHGSGANHDDDAEHPHHRHHHHHHHHHHDEHDPSVDGPQPPALLITGGLQSQQSYSGLNSPTKSAQSSAPQSSMNSPMNQTSAPSTPAGVAANNGGTPRSASKLTLSRSHSPSPVPGTQQAPIEDGRLSAPLTSEQQARVAKRTSSLTAMKHLLLSAGSVEGSPDMSRPLLSASPAPRRMKTTSTLPAFHGSIEDQES
jgi:hypothetical protein